VKDFGLDHGHIWKHVEGCSESSRIEVRLSKSQYGSFSIRDCRIYSDRVTLVDRKDACAVASVAKLHPAGTCIEEEEKQRGAIPMNQFL